MAVLVTGAAGFIGFHTAQALLARGWRVVGIDNLNDYYDVRLKQARLALLEASTGFTFHKADLAEDTALTDLAARHPDITHIVHLAAQPGVRYSLENPRAYVRANVVAHLEILELARHLPNLAHLVYASSSSVYGASARLPFALDDPCDAPQSLYAATKKADELMTHTYAHLYGVKATGLRFFTVYGPWGRPDMSPFLFTKAILEGKPIRLFNRGEMERDFTYVDDAVGGVLAALDHPPDGVPPHRLFNLGNHRCEPLKRFVSVIEAACGRPADIILDEMQPGDVRATYADIAETTRVLDFVPRTPIDDGIPRFVRWYRDFYQV